MSRISVEKVYDARHGGLRNDMVRCLQSPPRIAVEPLPEGSSFLEPRKAISSQEDLERPSALLSTDEL